MKKDLVSYYVRHAFVEAIWGKSDASRKKWYSTMETETFQIFCDALGTDAGYLRKIVREHEGTDKPRPLVLHDPPRPLVLHDPDWGYKNEKK